jgi:hypothetical protein
LQNGRIVVVIHGICKQESKLSFVFFSRETSVFISHALVEEDKGGGDKKVHKSKQPLMGLCLPLLKAMKACRA